jgi:hypothetical protein
MSRTGEITADADAKIAAYYPNERTEILSQSITGSRRQLQERNPKAVPVRGSGDVNQLSNLKLGTDRGIGQNADDQRPHLSRVLACLTHCLGHHAEVITQNRQGHCGADRIPPLL